ncbi:MAG: hypothetical protein ACOZFS_16250 [Thermodesulfobacteriota bacterium]
MGYRRTAALFCFLAVALAFFPTTAPAIIADLGAAGPCGWGALNLASEQDPLDTSNQIYISSNNNNRRPGVYIGPGPFAGPANVGAYRGVGTKTVQDDGWVQGAFYDHTGNVTNVLVQNGGTIDGGIIKTAGGDTILQNAYNAAATARGILDTAAATLFINDKLEIVGGGALPVYNLNVISGDYLLDIRDELKIDNGGILAINAPLGSQVVIRTGKFIDINNSSQVTLSGGILCSDVIFYSENASENIQIANSSTAYGIFFAPRADFQITNSSTLYGEAIVGGVLADDYQLQITNSSVIYSSCCIPIPPSVWLLGSGLIPLGLKLYRRKK